MKEASFYKQSGGMCFCRLCPHFCSIEAGNTGKCGVRKNIEGKLYSLVYGKPCSMAVDPIEKKPFFHFAPGSSAFSVATAGCNLSCQHCQNWEISQQPKQSEEIIGKNFSPEETFDLFKKSGAHGMAWTYTEPTVFYEYFRDTAWIDKERRFFQVWVSNGFTSDSAASEVSSRIDAANIDYKGDDIFYSKICGARLEPVLEAMKIYRKNGAWIEVTNLLIPGMNDSKDHVLQMVKWIRENLGRDTPLHFSAYHPDYMMKTRATNVLALEKAAKIADDYLDYVYVGNISHERESTFCPECGELVIRRAGFSVEHNLLKRKNNEFFCSCGSKIPIAGARWAFPARLSQKR